MFSFFTLLDSKIRAPVQLSGPDHFIPASLFQGGLWAWTIPQPHLPSNDSPPGKFISSTEASQIYQASCNQTLSMLDIFLIKTSLQRCAYYIYCFKHNNPLNIVKKMLPHDVLVQGVHISASAALDQPPSSVLSLHNIIRRWLDRASGIRYSKNSSFH